MAAYACAVCKDFPAAGGCTQCFGCQIKAVSTPKPGRCRHPKAEAHYFDSEVGVRVIWCPECGSVRFSDRRSDRWRRPARP